MGSTPPVASMLAKSLLSGHFMPCEPGGQPHMLHGTRGSEVDGCASHFGCHLRKTPPLASRHCTCCPAFEVILTRLEPLSEPPLLPYNINNPKLKTCCAEL